MPNDELLSRKRRSFILQYIPLPPPNRILFPPAGPDFQIGEILAKNVRQTFQRESFAGEMAGQKQTDA